MRSGTSSVTALCDGPPRTIGGFGGWEARARDRRDGYVSYAGTELAGWEIDLVIGTLVSPRSIRLEQMALSSMCSWTKRGGAFTPPPPLAAFGPGEVSGLFVCESLSPPVLDYMPDGVTPVMLQATVRLRVYEMPDVATSKLDKATSSAASKAAQEKERDDAEAKARAAYLLALSKARERAKG